MPPRRQLPRPSANSDDPSTSQSRMKTRTSATDFEVAVYVNSKMLLHHHLDEITEVPGRIKAIKNKIRSDKLKARCAWPHVRRADTADLTMVHKKDYVGKIRGLRLSTQGEIDSFAHKYNSIELCNNSYLAAEYAAGAVVQASLDVESGKYKRALCIVRPPGHHSLPNRPMGFCIYNNVAIAAKILLERTSTTKILIVDWDIHHGNGTQRVFWKDKRVLYFSVHRADEDFYPWNADKKLYPTKDRGLFENIGEEVGKGYTVNVPWNTGGYGDGDYLAVWDHILVPIAKAFEPQIILVSAGFDSAKGDIGGCNITPYGYYHMTKKLMESGNGKVLLALEGGYDPETVAESTTACLKALLGDDDRSSKELLVSEANDPLPYTWHVIKEVREKLKAHWPTLASEIPRKKVIQKKAMISSKSQTVKGSCVEPVNLPKERKRKLIIVKHSRGFPVRIRRMLGKGKYAKYYDKSATHYCAAVIEYLLGEILHLAGEEAINERVKRIQPRHFRAAVQKDEELLKFLKEVIFPLTGIPCI